MDQANPGVRLGVSRRAPSEKGLLGGEVIRTLGQYAEVADERSRCAASTLLHIYVSYLILDVCPLAELYATYGPDLWISSE